MSNFVDANQWLKQVRGFNNAVELFREKPSKERQESLIAEVEAYAYAAKIKAMEIPRIFRSY